MKNLQKRRSASVYAVLALAGIVAAAIIWLGFREIEAPTLSPLSLQPSQQRGAGDDILPVIVRPSICDDDRPCS